MATLTNAFSPVPTNNRFRSCSILPNADIRFYAMRAIAGWFMVLLGRLDRTLALPAQRNIPVGLSSLQGRLVAIARVG